MGNKQTGITRILSASAAAWVRIGVTVISQIALVPLFLASWDAEIFGAWLLLHAIWAAVSIVDLAHHDYVGYECLRLGPSQRLAVTQIIFSAAPFVVLVALFDLLLIWQIGQASFIAAWMGDDEQLIAQWQAALLWQAATWLLTGSVSGLIVRWLTPFGYWPRFAWWGVVNSMVTSLAPALAVVGGANLLQAVIVLCLSNLVYHFFLFVSLTRIVRKEGLIAVKPGLNQGFSQVLQSFWLVAKSLSEMARQQGSRILLAPLAGVAEMAAFATMRTGANFALQGLNTITGPVMPELMRFLTARDQGRTESTFAIVWLMLCIALCPAIVVVQWLAPAAFPIWTHGKIVFDSWLFGMLSLSVAVLALAQPAAAVLQGNNVLHSQLAISIGAAIVAVGGMAWLVPQMGVRGAALAFLIAELTSLVAYVWIAHTWLRNVSMHWPWKAFGAAAIAVLISALGMVLMEILPPSMKLISLAATLFLQFLVTVLYWRFLPIIARERAARLLDRWLPIHRMRGIT